MHRNFVRTLVSRLSISLTLVLGLILGLAWESTPVLAREFPSKTITIIVPWAAGGGSDITCRIIAIGLKKYLGQNIVVKTMPGGGSLVGAKALVESPPDGYTIGWLGVSAALAQYTTLAPVMMDEYITVARTIHQPLMLLVKSDAPWKSIPEFLEHAKGKKIKNGNAGTGVIDHIFSGAFAKETGVEFIQAPYTGWAPALAALAGGHIDVVFAGMAASRPLLKAGKIRSLGVSADTRRAMYPEVPTFREQGVTIRTTAYWESFVVPKGTPASVVRVLEDAIDKSLRDPEVEKKLRDSDIEIEFLGSQASAAFRKEQDDFLKTHVDALGLRIKK